MNFPDASHTQNHALGEKLYAPVSQQLQKPAHRATFQTFIRWFVRSCTVHFNPCYTRMLMHLRYRATGKPTLGKNSVVEHGDAPPGLSSLVDRIHVRLRLRQRGGRGWPLMPKNKPLRTIAQLIAHSAGQQRGASGCGSFRYATPTHGLLLL